MIIKRQKIYGDLIDDSYQNKRGEAAEGFWDQHSGLRNSLIAGTAIAGTAFLGHRGYLGGHMMKWTNKGLYKAGNLFGSNTLMNKGAQGYLAGSMKTGGILTGKGAREFYKNGASGIMERAGKEAKDLSKFANNEKFNNTNLGKALAETNKDLGLGKDGIGKMNTHSLGVDSGVRGVSNMNKSFNTNFDVTTRGKIGEGGTLNIVDAHGKSNNVLGTFKTEGTGDNIKTTWNPTQQQTPPQQPAQ